MLLTWSWGQILRWIFSGAANNDTIEKIMSDTPIKPFSCDAIDKALIRGEWEKWLRSFKLYLAAEEITDTVKKRNKLLHYGGVQLQEVAYNLPNAIVDYDEEEDNDVFQNLVAKLSEYFSPRQNSAFERHVFRNLRPEEGENLNKFLLRTRQQAKKCSFGSTVQEATEIHIKDKLIDCWAPLELKRKLLEQERSLDEIIEMCQVHEQTGGQSKAMSTAVPSVSNASVNKIKIQPKNNKHIECTRCGKQGHAAYASDCPARLTKCHKCGYIGHYASCCRSRQNKRHNNSKNLHEPRNKRKRTSSKVNFIDRDSDMSENDGRDDSRREYECFKITDRYDDNDTEDELIVCKVGGIDIKLLIDSGSKVNILKKRTGSY
ncbi:unnamed protein product [Callosobruchus maculatus]|uniref:CCHC-type domain-containing protein n=1 Tax=Callosobruchus maculatus TaxID=64391 RepID=A0A653DNU9_CALMS|nr:unnamed protein product [Callosobruchus maculatus]